MAELPPPPEGMVLTHFIVSDDVERSRRFYTEVLGGRVVFGPVPINVALANSWIVINAGGGPTDEWSARGAQFLTPPKQHQYEKRCYIRDPDGHLIEVGQTTDPDGDWYPAHWPPTTPAGDSG
jgi:catechol 2,3-dioxygenase-like lactoylglutathione lyase family enzyme